MTDAHVHVNDPDLAARGSCIAHSDAFAILSHCHEHILEKLDVLEGVGRELIESPDLQDRHLARLGEVLAFLDTAIPLHSADEEQSLFPRLRALPPFFGIDGTPMDCMEAEHVEHAALKARLKVAIVKRDAEAAGRCALTMTAAYRDHIAKEEEILFPTARLTLTDPAILETMAEEMRARRREVGLLDC